MRLKSYNAPTMAEAMRMVREELGEDAIIVSTQHSSDGQGVRITAALEDPGDDDDIQRALSGRDTTPFGERVRDALEYHGTPARLVEKMVQAAMAVEVGSPTMACATALEDHFDFAPLPERKSPRPFMLVGPPGSGKTITTAKLAARARLAGRPVGVKVTLRKDRMYEFLDRLVTTALPRVRDFRGVSGKSFDGKGNYAMGLKEHIVFVEIDYDKTETVWGMDIIIQTSARTDDEAKALLAGFRMPFVI